MRMEVERYAIYIYPNNDTDVAYIEDTLGLKKAGDSIKLTRRNAMGLSIITCLKTQREES